MAKSFTKLVPLAVAMALACGASGPVYAEEGELVKNLLGNLGVIDKDREPINYRERAPLAVPPKLSLPTPAAPPSARAAAWPEDVDLVKRKREVAERQKPVPFPNDNQVSQGARLSRDELQRLSRPTSPASRSGPREVYGDGRLSTWVDPDDLRKSHNDSTTDPSKLAYGQEPERGTLMQPPSGYRMPASNAPLRASKEPVEFDNGNKPERDFYKKRD